MEKLYAQCVLKVNWVWIGIILLKNNHFQLVQKFILRPKVF